MTLGHSATALLLLNLSLPGAAKVIELRADLFPPAANGARSFSIRRYIAARVRPGDTLAFAPGIFDLDGPIYLCDSLLVRGTVDSLGRKTTVLRRNQSWNGEDRIGKIWDKGQWVDGGRTGGSLTGLIAQCYGRSPVHKVTVRDLILEGHSYADAEIAKDGTAVSLIFLGGSGIRVTNCEARHSPYMGIVVLGGVNNTVDSCLVFNTARDGIFAGGARNIRIANNHISRTRDNAIGFDCNNAKDETGNYAGGMGSVIADNYIDNSDTVGYRTGDIRGYCRADSQYHSSYGIYVGRNRQFGQKNARGEVAAVESVAVSGNTVLSPWLHGILVESYCRHVIITGNRITGVRRWHGIALEGHNRDVAISANTISLAPWYGIAVTDGDSVTISKNTVSSCGHAAVAADSVSAGSRSVSVTGNIIGNCGEKPIIVKGKCADCRIWDNVVR